MFHIMKTRSSKYGIHTLTYNGAKIWNHFYFDFIFNELNLATSRLKRSLENQKVISNDFLIDAICNNNVYESHKYLDMLILEY